MMIRRLAQTFASGCLLLWIGLAPAWGAKPTAADILRRFRPRQEGVAFVMPSEQEQANCTVDLVPGKHGASAWLVRDPQGRPLCRLADTNGDKKIDVWSYYRDGVEIYREIDSKFEEKGPDQYRWINSAGSKWGLDLNRDGKIDTWKTISAEEVSQEILQAVLTRDFARLQALFLTDTELDSLGLPAADVTRIRELQKQAPAKFQTACERLNGLNDKTHWIHLETAAPQCQPSDILGSRQDVVKYTRGTILCETAGKNDYIQTGEMILVGAAWRIIDAPTPGEGDAGGGTQVDPALQTLLDKLREHDTRAPKLTPETPGANSALVEYNLTRATILEEIVAKVKAEEREQWIRQIADCLGAAAQNSPETDKTAYERLTRLEDQIVKAIPKSALAAYVTYREMQAENSAKLGKPGPDTGKVLEQWLDRLSKFVETYPTAEDTPEALMELGMASEFLNKEIQAKKWYGRLAKEFAENPLAVKAQGALRRLDLEGKPLDLAGSLLDGGAFNLNQLRGKVVVVYYWSSRNKDRCVADFAALKLLLETYGSRGLALVTVNLDDSAEQATAFLQRSSAPGSHLFQPGGLESPLATQYGVMVLPQLFLVDKDGKVLSRTIQQVSGLEDELKKQLK
jgi:peroxiredoxin